MILHNPVYAIKEKSFLFYLVTYLLRLVTYTLLLVTSGYLFVPRCNMNVHSKVLIEGTNRADTEL